MGRAALLTVSAFISFGGVAVVVVGAGVLARAGRRRELLSSVALLGLFGAATLAQPPVGFASNAAVLAGALGIVLLLTRPLSTPGSVVAFLVTAALVDFFSFSGGLTNAIVEAYREGRSSILLYLTLVISDGGRFIPVVGIGDLVVGGAASSALITAGVRATWVAGGLSAGLVAALVVGIWRGGVAAVPFLAVAFALVVWRHAAAGARSNAQA